MIINQITYMAKGQVALLDDIITLRLKLLNRAGAVMATPMISGHSSVLTNRVYEIEPVDVDSIFIEATDLDYEGHTLKFNNYEYTIPRTGSLTGTFKIEPVGAPEVTEVSAPGVVAVETAITQEEFAERMRLPAPGSDVPVPGGEVPKAAAIGGATLVVVGIIALLVLSGRKKK